MSAPNALLKSSAFSSSSAKPLSVYATIASRVVFGPEIESDEPHERNSNLLPVNANGDVRFRSVESFGIGGNASTPIVSLLSLFTLYGFPSLIDSKMPCNSSPKYTEIIAGGASFAPSRWSFPAVATEMRSKS